MQTPPSLLERLRQPADDGAWARFVELYAPLLHGWLARRGCPGGDIADLMQDVFLTLVQVLPTFTYDRHKSFRHWLRTVALNKWRDRLKQRELPLVQGNDWAEAVPAEADDPFWEHEYRGLLARRALEIMQKDFPGKTWMACWQMVVDGSSAADVASRLGLSRGAVHAARFRVLERLRQELAGLLE
jgi:RNA polymerase sigma-70 factor (ECF subfamily)